MSSDNNEKKRFITNIREMTNDEKLNLGVEGLCYVIGAVAFGLGVAMFIEGDYVGTMISGIQVASFGLSSRVLRSSRNISKMNRETMQTNQSLNDLGQQKTKKMKKDK